MIQTIIRRFILRFFNGRVSQKSFIIRLIIAAVLGGALLSSESVDGVMKLVLDGFVAVTLVVYVTSLAFRRIHDLNYSGWFVLPLPAACLMEVLNSIGCTFPFSDVLSPLCGLYSLGLLVAGVFCEERNTHVLPTSVIFDLFPDCDIPANIDYVASNDYGFSATKRLTAEELDDD